MLFLVICKDFWITGDDEDVLRESKIKNKLINKHLKI